MGPWILMKMYLRFQNHGLRACCVEDLPEEPDDIQEDEACILHFPIHFPFYITV